MGCRLDAGIKQAMMGSGTWRGAGEIEGWSYLRNNKVKYLGAWIDDELKWNTTVINIMIKAWVARKTEELYRKTSQYTTWSDVCQPTAAFISEWLTLTGRDV